MLGLLRRSLPAAPPPLSRASSSDSGNVRTVTLIPGDGIGPEIAKAVQRSDRTNNNKS